MPDDLACHLRFQDVDHEEIDALSSIPWEGASPTETGRWKRAGRLAIGTSALASIFQVACSALPLSGQRVVPRQLLTTKKDPMNNTTVTRWQPRVAKPGGRGCPSAGRALRPALCAGDPAEGRHLELAATPIEGEES